MDSCAWAPKTAAVLAAGAAGIVMGLGAVLVADDVPGRLMGGVAAVGLLVFAAGSWRARPRLALTDEGLVYRGWLRTRTLTRADIDSIRITEFRRIGRKVRMLEIDSGDNLIVLTRWDLGADPLIVLDSLATAGWAGSSPDAGWTG